MSAEPKWEYKVGYALKNGKYQRLYRDDALGVQMERYTSPRKSRTFFFIDGDETEYKTCADMMAAHGKKGETK